ncbi:MAG: flagellar biosynthesis protein FlhB [Zetaproteobacteria bacterium]|nr:MAG: flagellar biosynthesis protein FlhB [Zetaproteobacteria bacterium]
MTTKRRERTRNTRYRQPAAVALNWNPLIDALPYVSASGRGAEAERILKLAAEHDIPIHHDEDLLQVLSLLDVGAQIPDAVHDAVAEILAFVFWTNQRYAEILGGGTHAPPTRAR